jgi:hypothetical protein
MRKFIGTLLLVLGATTGLMAEVPPTVPEINVRSGMAALGLLAGAVLILRGRRKN